jgi:hypothetical protein
MLDIELVLNNRPLSYVEDDIQIPILTPNNLMFGQRGIIREEDVDCIDEASLRKRARYVEKCKNPIQFLYPLE